MPEEKWRGVWASIEPIFSRRGKKNLWVKLTVSVSTSEGVIFEESEYLLTRARIDRSMERIIDRLDRALNAYYNQYFAEKQHLRD